MDKPVGSESPEDLLAVLHGAEPLREKLEQVHDFIRRKHSCIDRIALTSYDAETDNLRTFVHSTVHGDSPLTFYQSRLAESQSLSEIASSRRPRVVNDIDATYTAPRQHAEAIRRSGFGASYTMPIFHNGQLYGFVFFNSREKNVFNERVLFDLKLISHLLALMMVSELSVVRTLTASVRTITHIMQSRDFETGTHLERMAHYSRLIARHVAPHFGLDDVFVEYLYLFAPLHDIGKISIPDAILLKPARLSESEFMVIREHATKGSGIIDAMLQHFGLSGFQYSEMLRNIALYHHEALDGSGYPYGLKGADIPVESRIVAVADVFDALSSNRPYKSAWDTQTAFTLLQKEAGTRFDPVCVQALVDHPEEVAEIQRQFAEEYIG